jgi:transcriptional regulator with XRE-family HTH domain
MLPMTLLQRVVDGLVKSAGGNESEVARRLRVSPSQVHRWRRGAGASAENMATIARAAGLQISDLLSGRSTSTGDSTAG